MCELNITLLYLLLYGLIYILFYLLIYCNEIIVIDIVSDIFIIVIGGGERGCNYNEIILKPY